MIGFQISSHLIQQLKYFWDTFLLSVVFVSIFGLTFSTFLFIKIYFLRGVSFLPAIAIALPFLVLALH